MDEYIFRIKLLLEIILLEDTIYNNEIVIDRSKLTSDHPLITLITVHQNLKEKLTLKLKKE